MSLYSLNFSEDVYELNVRQALNVNKSLMFPFFLLKVLTNYIYIYIYIYKHPLVKNGLTFPK
jgi:hypothetical protein